MPIRIAIIGFGKIARDQHLPSIRSDSRFELAAVATRSGDPDLGVPWFARTDELFEAMAGGLDAVAICTPPGARREVALAAMAAGIDVLLEKPPAATLGEIDEIVEAAHRHGRCLHAGWHSQHAGGVAEAARLLEGKNVAGLAISWLEDVRKWHPNQEWIWAPGGFGVFDPGINAFSIATRILPLRLCVTEARLTFPANRQTPIAARLSFGAGFSADLDWRHGDSECWTIRVQTVDGRVVELLDGGERLVVDGAERAVPERDEYPSIYDRFAELVGTGSVEVDREPLRIVADAFLVGRRETDDPFHWGDARA